MIIRIQASGSSFRGAGQYYLHDKAANASMAKDEKPRTDERVWFTDTRNLMSTDPELAFDEMWRTADDQAYLKKAAGVRTSGRACSEPVKTLSLSWHKDDAPTPEHMIAAADKLIQHMGWQEHQAVYVGHNDTEHRHIHIILNRVHPDTGRTLDDFRERRRAQSWALAYEKEHQNIRCEQRELNAAEREHRAAQLDGAGQEVVRRHPAPANDHLPHNVVLLTRPEERAFAAHEQAREKHDQTQRTDLKTEQRAEREAFFKDGAKLFKATRHAVYDEVRKEYAPEWRQYHKEREAAERAAEAASKTAVTRALHFAGRGEWDQARDAFDDRDSVLKDVAREFDARRAELRQRQTEDLRERQGDACDALRDIRDVQYQELLQRQRGERAAARAGQILADVGMTPERDQEHTGIAAPIDNAAANQNPAPTVQFTTGAQAGIEAQQQPGSAHGVEAPQLAADSSAKHQAAVERIEQALDAGPSENVSDAAPHSRRGITDLAAGAIGSFANYVADQLGELFAPTPPEVREAQARQEAKREASKPVVEENRIDPNEQLIQQALRLLEEEQQKKDNAYWKERDRGKGWERDQ